MSSRAAGALPRRWHAIPDGPVRALAGAAVVLGSAVLPGCTIAEPSDPPASAANAGLHSPAALSASAGLPSRGLLQTACGDDVGDGAGHDIAAAVLEREGGQLLATFTLAAPPDTGGTVITVELTTVAGMPLRRLGVELDGARPVAAYVAESSSFVERLDGPVHVDGAEVHATWPGDVLAGLGPNWGWVALIRTGTGTGTGTTVDDVCPGTGTGPASPIVVP